MAQGGPKHRALLVLLDGCRPDALLAADAPNLKKLAFDNGAFSFHVNCGGVPLSAPCWTTILTGVRQEDHHVTTNDLDALSLDAQGHVIVTPVPECVCAPARGPLCAIFRRGKSQRPAAPLPATIFEKLAQESCSSALFTVGSWEGIGRLAGAPPRTLECRVDHASLSIRYFEASLEQELQATKEAITEAIRLVEDGDDGPELVAVYLHFIDGNGHEHGFGYDVPEYRAAITAIDSEVGRLIDSAGVRAAAGREDWLVVVTTDHGGTSQRRMPPEMRRNFASCGCVQKGISQVSLRGVHGLRELTQHTQTFQILGLSKAVQSGEMLPQPAPEDVVPTLLQHIVGGRSDSASWPGAGSKARGLLPRIPPIPTAVEEPPPGEPASKSRRVEA